MESTHILRFFLLVLILFMTTCTESSPTRSSHRYTKRYGYHDSYQRDFDRARRIARGSKEAARMSRLINRNKHVEHIRGQKRHMRNIPKSNQRFRSAV